MRPHWQSLVSTRMGAFKTIMNTNFVIFLSKLHSQNPKKGKNLLFNTVKRPCRQLKKALFRGRIDSYKYKLFTSFRTSAGKRKPGGFLVAFGIVFAPVNIRPACR